MVNAEQLSEHLWRFEFASQTLPPNKTTNSYVMHSGDEWLLIDPGFHERYSWNHLRTFQVQQGWARLAAVLLTHSHKDHCAGLPFVRQTFSEVAVYLHSEEQRRLEYANTRSLDDGDVFALDSVSLQAIFSPGHSPGHLSFFEPNGAVLLAGDLVSTSGSTWVGVPEGSVADYLDSIARLEAFPAKLLAPGHGAVSHEPDWVLRSSLEHRLERLEQVYQCLSEPRSLKSLQQQIYPQLSDGMRRFADASLLALLEYLEAQDRIHQLGQSEDVENQVFAQSS